MRMSYMTRWADGVDCMCFLSFVFLCVARRLELSPCNTMRAVGHNNRGQAWCLARCTSALLFYEVPL